MKIALVHDWLVNIAGAEKVLEAIYELYPGDIFTLIQNSEKLKGSLFEKANINTSFIQKLPLSKKIYRSYFPLFPIAIEQFNLRDYQIIISSSHAVAKGVLTSSDQLHICYCHTPIRYAWDLYHDYLSQLTFPKRILAAIFLHYIRIWDQSTTNRVDYYIANSKFVYRRIKKIYGREAQVIYPPVDVNKFEIGIKKEDFYITISRMVPYKRIDLIVKAFSFLPDRRLIVIGEGPEFQKIKKIAPPNVELLGYQPFEVLKNLLKKAKAFIFAAEEDFGILPVEAQAAGTPVIAYGKGGVTETVIENKTGIFFYRRTPEDIADAIKRFETIEDKFDPYEIRKNAERFSKERFKREFYNFVEEKKLEFFS